MTAPARLPLAGVRVVELCWAWAGPLAARLLSDLGADVIKLEGPRRPDAVRFGTYPNDEPGERPWNRGGHFIKHGRGKRSLVLDLNAEQGKEAFRRLLASADIFLENNSPRVLPNLGFSYDTVRHINPRLVMVSMPGFGSDGPLRDWVAFGLNIEAMTGQSSITGYEDEGPVRSAVPYGDPVAGLHAAIAAMSALRRARRTGEGCHIEIAQNESLLNLMAEPLIEAQVGPEPPRPGVRDERFTLHGVFACRGDDRWVAVAARDASQVQTLRTRLDEEGQAGETLEARLERKLASLSVDEALAFLRDCDILAEPVQTMAEVFRDPDMRARGFFWPVDQPEVGTHEYAFLPFLLHGASLKSPTPAPMFGEHSREILRELGYQEPEIDELFALGVTTAEPVMG